MKDYYQDPGMQPVAEHLSVQDPGSTPSTTHTHKDRHGGSCL